MKILLTGMTAQQCGRVPLVGYMTVVSCVRQMLIDAGHEVDQRRVELHEDLGGYDLIVAGIMSPFSVAAKQIFGVVDVFHRYWMTGKIPVLSLVDDWTLHQIDQNSQSARRSLYRLVRPSIFDHRPHYEWATSTEGWNVLRQVFERIVETGWPPAIYPAFGWGDRSVFEGMLMAEGYYPLDPTCYTPPYAIVKVPSEERVREWVLAVIQDHSDWLRPLGPTWPLNQIGGGLTKRESTRPEHEVVQEYARCRGVLSPHYRRLSGSGWWRNRFVYAAMTRSILYCDPEEAPQLGESYAQPLSVIEAMTDTQLDELAEEQATSLRKNCWTGDQLQDAVSAMLSEAMEHRWA